MFLMQKLDFVKVGPQEWTRWLVAVVKKCHDYGLMVNIHDAYRPIGLSLSFPKVLTQEGIRGNEHFPTAEEIEFWEKIPVTWDESNWNIG